jgi:hypothetical protein
VTIAAGFACLDGVMLCADTEVSTWQSKTHESKLDFVEFNGGKAIFAYAGHVRFAKCAIQKCKRRLEWLDGEDALTKNYNNPRQTSVYTHSLVSGKVLCELRQVLCHP